jgi:DNA-binding MarR family transcriptional regulator
MPTDLKARRSGAPGAADDELGAHALAIISFLYNRVVTGAAPAVRKRMGLSVTEARIVFFVGAGGATTVNKLARYMGLDKAAVSRGTNRLIGLGLVESKRDPQHGLRNLLSLTGAGREAWEAIAHFSFAREEYLLSVLTREEQRQFLKSLQKILTMVDSTNRLVELGNFWP